MELSGPQWVGRYPTSKSISDLTSPFKENLQAFYDALIKAGATVKISATLRPKQRAFLMHTSFDIAKKTIKPQDAPKLEGVDINWVHASADESVKAAQQMVDGYGIVFRPAYPTKHSTGTAIDMNVSWTGVLKIKLADGTEKVISSTPRDNSNHDLHVAANTYNVHKLVTDAPHWSDNGH
ncbi:peptidoglycan-binding domain-containing protein [Mucilaginibacter celer]|uniref:Peptidoglycan-binding domain-containing protein n=1 Tax=Mucilaginibacter celer TaxID=2305508 RepID=A0A494VR26_9SPHI|nr:peptidoglycan-binding domain-containing protein [Mucilaginibacter celer]AYL96481.1 peptidoglycan-binding domain-containing protein [Mucilaginibacter celer]